MWPAGIDRIGFAVAAFLLLGLVGCDEGTGKGVALPGKVGPSGELVVVCSDTEWYGPVGKRIREVFEQPFPLLPQLEPAFDLQQLDRESFDRFWKPHRNVLVVDIGDRIDTQTLPSNGPASRTMQWMRSSWARYCRQVSVKHRPAKLYSRPASRTPFLAPP